MTLYSRAYIPMLAALASCGCVVNDLGGRLEQPGETITEKVVIQRSKAPDAEMLKVDLTMGAGELVVSPGAKELMEGVFTYNVPGWKPEVKMDGAGFRARLSVKQGSASSSFGEVKNIWDLKLADNIPLDLSIRCGAGENKLNLGAMSLRSVQIEMGAGQVDMDLRGKPAKSYEVRIEGGVGQAKVYLPSDVGIAADAHGGIGEIKVRGLKKDGDRWVNDALGKSKVTIHLTVKGGIGEIDINAE
jgi:hypothetical protein